MNIEELKELLDEFLARWSKDKVLKMALEAMKTMINIHG